MSWEVTADPLRFEEAEQWFRNRVPLTRDEWNALSEAARQRAFTVSGVAQLDLVNDTWRSLQEALEEGQDFGEWKKAIGDRLEAAWGKKSASRLETIFFQNVQSAYSAGRYKQLTDPDVIKARPFWLYDAVMDSRTTKLCSRLNGTVRPADDSWWDTHTPPLHFFCRSGIRSLTRKQAAPRITEKPPELTPPKGFGQRPDLVAWQPDAAKYPPELWQAYEAKRSTGGGEPGGGGGRVPPVSQHPADKLIRELIATRRGATEEEATRIGQRIAAADFNREPSRVPIKMRGVAYLGRTLGAREESLFYHLAKRVVFDQQWAEGTTAEAYLADLRAAAGHKGADLLIYQRDGVNYVAGLTPNFIPPSRLGSKPKALLYVVYSADSARIQTGYQIDSVRELNLPGDFLWLK